MADDKPLILVDGSSYLFRAFHALPPLATSEGQPTGAVYGVAGMLRKLIERYPDSPFAFVFDASGPTFRNELYAEYKSHRPPMPDALRQQIEPLYRLIRALGLPLIEEPGVEADDVIGTLARRAAEQGRRTVISTGDKDLAQLVDERVTLVNTMTDTVSDIASVHAKYGVAPEHIVDLLALTGDPVDNIPGIEKVGPKTAAKWLGEYGSLEGVLEHADDIKGKLGENLRAVAEQLPVSKDLATIRCGLDLAVAPEDLQRSPRDETALLALTRELEFKAWTAELNDPRNGGGTRGDARPDYEIVTDADVLERWIERLRAAGRFAFDTETTSLAYMRAQLVGVSFAVGIGEAAYVPFAHDYIGAPAQLSFAHVIEALRPLLENERWEKVVQNLKYDLSVLARHGVELRGAHFDTMLESYVLDTTATRHNLDDMALKFLGREPITFEAVAGKGAKQVTFNQVPLEAAGPYAAEDADLTWQLHERLWPRLAAEAPLRGLFETLEMPLVPVLSRMERNGALIDGDLLAHHSTELATRLQELEATAWREAGHEFNLGSTKQLQAILYDELGLPVRRRTPKGAPSTAEPVLAELAEEFALPRLVLDYRAVSKLKSTYADALPLQIDPETGRVHTSFHQAVTATGRLSSSEPNLQNIPIRTPEGRRIRQAFIAAPGARIVAADYSQIELRIMAHISADPSLCEAFAQDLDIHRATAAEVFATALEDVSETQRRGAKAINFGLIYGMSAWGLSRRLDIEPDQAQRYIDRYFERYPGVRAYMDRTRQLAREQGYVETLFGRRLHVPEIRVANQPRRQAAERTAINAPMQGTAADIIKRAMLGVDAWLRESGLDALMIMQVHDELVFEVAEADVDALAAGVREHMVAAARLDVPLQADVGVGANWDEAH